MLCLLFILMSFSKGLCLELKSVSLVHHEAFDVLRSSHASQRQKTALGRCWIDIEL